jgi:pectinesterase
MNYRRIKRAFVHLALLAAIPLSAQVTYDMTVAKDGSGNYTTVQAAFNAVGANKTTRTVIYIKNGTYTENLTLDATRKNVTIIGQSRDNVKLTYNNYSGKVVNGVTLSTSTSSSTYIKSDGFCAINISFENSSGPVGQAVAVYIIGDKSVFYNCKFLGRQDTWYADRCRQFIRNCYIEGTTDFMFGPSTAWVDSCQLYSYGGTALTAASTEQYVAFGYVFRHCSISGASGVSTALGRPWRPYAAVSFLNCSLTSCINAVGWDDWGDAANETTARYSEYKNTGTGAVTTGRVGWAKQLSDAQAANYTYLGVLKTTYANPPVVDNWDPMATLALYTEPTGINGPVRTDKAALGECRFSIVPGARTVTITGVTSNAPLVLKVCSVQGRTVYTCRAAGRLGAVFSLPRLESGMYLFGVGGSWKKVVVQ